MGTRAGDVPSRLLVRIRPAGTGDVPAMGAIELTAFSDPWPESSFSDLLRQSHARVTVALWEHELVGYCVLLRAADEGEIANIAVRPSVRGQGVGAQLLDDAVRAADAEGVIRLFLEVRTSNRAARALYASRGFEPVGRRRAYYHDPLEDALVLRRSTDMAI